MSSVFYSNNTLTCVNDNDEDDKAAGVAVLAVVVASFLMSCTVIVVTIVSARNVVKRGSVSSDIDDVVVVADAEVYATVARRGTAVSAVVFQASAEMGCVDNDDNDVFEDEDDGLDTLYDKPTTDAERIYGPIMIRTPRRSSSIFPPIDEDRATSGDESCKSVSGRTPSCASGHNCQHRGTLLRSSASSGVLRTRKSSDILQIPFPDHGTLVRTRSQEQVARLTEILFSGKPSKDLLDPNSILGDDDSSRRPSSTSSGRRKKSLDYLFANLLNPESPGSAKSQRRRESTPIVGTSNGVSDEKVFKRSVTSSDIFVTPFGTNDVSTTNETSKRRGLGVSKLVKEFEKFATIRSRHFIQSESVIEETDSSKQQQQPATATAAAASTSSKNIFVKNNRKISSTVPKNLLYKKQTSLGDNTVYRRQRRDGIHVETSNSTEV